MNQLDKKILDHYIKNKESILINFRIIDDLNLWNQIIDIEIIVDDQPWFYLILNSKLFKIDQMYIGDIVRIPTGDGDISVNIKFINEIKEDVLIKFAYILISAKEPYHHYRLIDYSKFPRLQQAINSIKLLE